MPFRRVESQPGRAYFFFTLLRYIMQFVGAPVIILHHSEFEEDVGQFLVFAFIAVYAESMLASFFRCKDVAEFYYRWKTRNSTPLSHSRRLRGFKFPKFIVRISEDNTTGMQTIPKCALFRTLPIAVLVQILICVVPTVFHFISVGRKKHLHDTVTPSRKEQSSFNTAGLTTAETIVVSIFLFILGTITADGNYLASALFVQEFLFISGAVDIRGPHVRVILIVLFSFWFTFETIALLCTICVYSSSDPTLRAFADVYLFKVTTDVVVSRNNNRVGRIDVGPMYISLQEHKGSVFVSVDTEPSTRQVFGERVSDVALTDKETSSQEAAQEHVSGA